MGVTYTGADGLKGAVPAGTVVAAAVVSGEKHQYVKLEFGDSDTAATKVSTGDPLPVVLSTGSVVTLTTGSVTTLSTDSTIVADPTPASTAAVTSLAASTSTGAQTLLAANASRKGGSLFRDIGSGLVCVRLGGTATTAAYSFQLTQGALYELPMPAFTGSLTAVVVTTSTAGALHITELT